MFKKEWVEWPVDSNAISIHSHWIRKWNPKMTKMVFLPLETLLCYFLMSNPYLGSLGTEIFIFFSTVLESGVLGPNTSLYSTILSQANLLLLIKYYWCGNWLPIANNFLYLFPYLVRVCGFHAPVMIWFVLFLNAKIKSPSCCPNPEWVACSNTYMKWPENEYS